MAKIVWNAKDLTGQKFNKWTVIKKYKTIGKIAFWTCRCDCGNIKNVAANSLTSGTSKSCGCLRSKQNNLSHSRLYQIWDGIKGRCYYKKDISYKNYGGRGVCMCDEWKNNFMSFYNWAIANGYKNDLQIDRIDNNGNYEPSNCKWSTRSEQARNRRSNILIKFLGKLRCLSEIAEIVKDDPRRISYIYRTGRIRLLEKCIINGTDFNKFMRRYTFKTGE